MPFVQRVVQPKFLSRINLHDDGGKPKIKDGELEAVTNFTLSSALRQLASVVLIANDIFEGLNKQLEDVCCRTAKLRTRIAAVDQAVCSYDPKMVTVPESDLSEFSARTDHWGAVQPLARSLFTADTRPSPVRRLYDAAAPTPVTVMRALDRYRRDGARCSKYFSVTPVLGQHRKKRPADCLDIDIETRLPAQVSLLRRWTSLEAMGDVTTDLDCTHRVTMSTTDDVDHRLPSPEEQVHAIALKFPSEMVTVDVSGRSFSRMSHLRRSLVHVPGEDTRRRSRRRPRGKRRNTIAGVDTKELAQACGDSSEGNFGATPEPEPSLGEKKSRVESLKEWGMRLLRTSEPVVKLRREATRRKWDKEEPTPHSSSGNWSASSDNGSTATSHHPRSSISSGSTCQKHGRRGTIMVSTSSSVTSESTLTPDDGETCSMYSCDTEGYYTSFHLDSGLKTLREEEPLPALHSMSALSGSRGNGSTLTADSEYELFGKGSTSTTASSAGTVCTTLLHPQAAPSVPERVNSQLSASLPERGVKALHSLSSKDPNVKETSSLKIEKKNYIKVDFKKLQEHKSNLTKENVAKLKQVDEKKGMITVEVHHNGDSELGPEKCGDSPDSGHNTCSSPVDSITSPSIDLEMSECSDLEGIDRVERIRVKTTINSSRIPSMCVITPPVSDDEVSLNALRGPVDMGDYVTISDVKTPDTVSPILTRETEYVSLNELPPNDSLERKRRQGARVTLDSEGKVVYSSDSLRRRKAIHTTQTFEPGPNVNKVSSPVMPRVANVRPVITSERRAQSSSPTRIISPTSTLTRQRSQSPGVSIGNTKQQADSVNLSSQTDFNRKPLSPVSSNRPISPLVSASNQRNSLVKSRSQQYFPKSSYGSLSPTKPMSPLVSSANQKSPNERDNSRPLSPSAVYPSHRSMSPKAVVRAKQVTKAVSPITQRGAYVKVQEEHDGVEDDLKNIVKRSDSYRMANNDTKSPISTNRKQLGVNVMAGPNLLTAIQTARPSKDGSLPEQNVSTPVKQMSTVSPARSHLLSSTPTKPNTSSNLDFSMNLSPINTPVSSQPSRNAMDLYAIIHESKKKIMKLRERNCSPTLTEKISKLQSSAVQTAPAKTQEVNRLMNSKANIPISDNVFKMNSNSRSSTPDNSVKQRISPIISERYLRDPRSNVPENIYAERLMRASPSSRSSTPEMSLIERNARTAPGSGSSTPEKNFRVIPEGPNWPKAIPASQVPNLRKSPSSYDYLNLSPSGHYQRTRSPSPLLDVNQFPSYPDYRSLPRMSHRNSPTPQSPVRQHVFAPRDPPSQDARISSPQHSSFASDRLGKVQPTSRNDFKQLLLRANWGTTPSSGSAVERLKNRTSPVKPKSWKSDILSSTIPEDCREDDEQSDRKTLENMSGENRSPGYSGGIPKSSALVNQQCKAFDNHRASPTDKNRISPTLETAL
ncbi:mucin-2-like [Macrosteles quadrilineatus]|uniref:mucin-2-like n=1 Tax=Macrosteles quadrilineatus TaxID=74068 RepID=UPI0023E131B9|nr:mucin-2-like [Macrosteles quadrilineatus]